MVRNDLALVDIALRPNVYHTRTYPSLAILVLSILVTVLVSVGATFGGSLVFEYGFDVETAATIRCGTSPNRTSSPATTTLRNSRD